MSSADSEKMKSGLLSITHTKELARSRSAHHGAFLKGAFLLYDRVILFARQDLVEAVAEEIGSGLSNGEKVAVRNALIPATSISPEMSMWSTSDVFAMLNRLIGDGIIEGRVGGRLLDFFMGTPDESRTETGLPSLHLSLALGATLHADPSEASSICSHLDRIGIPPITEERPLAASLPALDEISWARILELRNSPYLTRYRDFLSSYHLDPDATQSIVTEMNEALWDAMGNLKPTANGSIIKRVISNLPVPILPLPNPYAVWRDAIEGSRERQLFIKHGWLWFIHEARQSNH